jgi:hypothetical protein
MKDGNKYVDKDLSFGIVRHNCRILYFWFCKLYPNFTDEVCVVFGITNTNSEQMVLYMLSDMSELSMPSIFP